MPVDRLSKYKIMWVFVYFDLPTETKKQRKAYTLFRKGLLKDGFTMFQYSIYTRHCPSMENAKVHIQRVNKLLPECGHVVIMSLTDKQFEDIQVFYGRKPEEPKKGPQQLELF